MPSTDASNLFDANAAGGSDDAGRGSGAESPDGVGTPDASSAGSPPLASSAEIAAIPPPDEMPYHRIESHSYSRTREWLAVLGAAGLPTITERESDGWCIFVQPHHAERARFELEAYERERKIWPAMVAQFDDPDAPDFEIGIAGLLVGIALVVFHLAYGSGDYWQDAGALDGLRVLHGEWWRCVTSLTLHGDIAHVLGNALALWLFGGLVCRRVGAGLGMLLIVACGAVGNYLTLVMQDFQHLAIGASTGIFAALGLLGGFQVVTLLRRRMRPTWRQIGVPILAVAAFLSLLGSSPGSDLGAHMLGAVTGVVGGLALPLLVSLRERRGWQIAGGGLTAIVVLQCWRFALAAAA